MPDVWDGVVSDHECVEQEIEEAAEKCCSHFTAPWHHEYLTDGVGCFSCRIIKAALLAQRVKGMEEERQFCISAICEYHADGAAAVVDVIRRRADELEGE